MALPPDMPDVSSGGSQKRRLPDDMPTLSKDFPEVTSVPHKLPPAVLGQLYTGAKAQDIAKRLKASGYDVQGEDEEYPTVNIDGQFYNINKPGLSMAEIAPLPYQGLMAIPGARMAGMAAKAAGVGIKALGARVLGQAGADVAQNVAEQQAQATVAGEAGRPIDVGETTTVAGLGGVGTLAERGISRIGKKIRAPEKGAKLEKYTSGLHSDKQIQEGLRFEAMGAPLNALQVNPLLENRSRVLAADAKAREIIADSMGVQSDYSRKMMSDLIYSFAPPPSTTAGQPTVRDIIESLDRGSPKFSAEASKMVKSEKNRISLEAAADWGNIRSALADPGVPEIDMQPVISKIEQMQSQVKQDERSWKALDKVRQMLITKKKIPTVVGQDANGVPIVKNIEVETSMWPKDKDVFDIKYDIQDIANAKRESESSINRHTAGKLADVVRDIDGLIEGQISSVPTLAEAKKRYAANKKNLRLLESGSLGKVAEAYDMDNLAAQREALRGIFAPGSDIDAEAAKRLQAYMRRTPEGTQAIDELIGDHLADLKGTSGDVTVAGQERIEGYIDSTPNGYYKAIFGQKERQKEVMYAMMSPEQRANAATAEKYLFYASGGRRTGADTMPKLAEEADLAKQGVSSALMSGVSGVGAKTVAYIGDMFTKFSTSKSKQAMAEAITDPRWASEMALFRQYVAKYDRTFDESNLKAATNILSSIVSRSSGRIAGEEYTNK